MSLRLIEGGKGSRTEKGGAVEAEATEIAKGEAAAKGKAKGKAKAKAAAAPLGARALAPGAPLSPGTLPLEFAVLLRSGEALIWWNEKERVSLRPVLAVIGICSVILALVTGFAPDFWLQPWESLWPPLAALFSPVLVIVVRELVAIRVTMVTDGGVIDVPRFGEPRRVSIAAITAVRRDLWTGGVRLTEGSVQLRVPPTLADDARRAIASSGRAVLRSRPVDDPISWLP
jgi:hypothetical protein